MTRVPERSGASRRLSDAEVREKAHAAFCALRLLLDRGCVPTDLEADVRGVLDHERPPPYACGVCGDSDEGRADGSRLYPFDAAPFTLTETIGGARLCQRCADGWFAQRRAALQALSAPSQERA